jgi:parallel beta-helix repeat protein
MKNFKLFLIVLICLTAISSPLSAKTFYVSNGGSDNNVGSRAEPLKTISKGAQLAYAGDTVYVLAGIYRERVSPSRGGTAGKPIVYMGEPGKRVYIKGSDVYKEEDLEQWAETVYVANLNLMNFTDDCYVDNANPFKVKIILDVPGEYANITLGQVFVKSVPYTQMTTKTKMNDTEGSWWYEASTNKVFVNFMGKHSIEDVVELTTRRRVFAPHATEMGLGYIHVEGFIIEHCGNQFPKWTKETMQAGALGLQSGHHWVVRNNVVRYAANAGIDCGFLHDTNERNLKPGWTWSAPGVTGNLIENNYLIDNGCVGITGTGTYQMICRNNVVMWNNTQGFPMENAEQAGIKFHGCNSCIISGNYVVDNFAFGIWLDNDIMDANTVEFYTGTLPILERGQLPGTDDAEPDIIKSK